MSQSRGQECPRHRPESRGRHTVRHPAALSTNKKLRIWVRSVESNEHLLSQGMRKDIIMRDAENDFTLLLNRIDLVLAYAFAYR